MNDDSNAQRRWSEVEPDDALAPLAFPLSVYRLVMAAGANWDFNSIHHNSDYARATGAADMYANMMLLQGMWERSVRGFIGMAGELRSLKDFRMKSFNTAGDTAVVHGKVKRKWRDGADHLVEIEIWTENATGVSVGPGSVVVALPS